MMISKMMNKGVKTIVLIMIFLTPMVSCKKEYVPPVFKDVVNVQLSKAKDGIVNMKADALLYNPNDAKAKLKMVDIKVFIDDKEVATMKKGYDLKISALSEFTVPMEVSLNLSEIGLMNSILGFLRGKQFEAHYVGKARIVVKGVPVKVPIDYHDKLKLR